MTDAAGYILVGGKSSRLGRDKALVKVGGAPLVLRVANALRPAVDTVTLVGSREKYRQLGLRVIPDAVTGFGPLAGILAALEDTLTRWNLVVACDMPNLTQAFLKSWCPWTRTACRNLCVPYMHCLAAEQFGAPSRQIGTRSPTPLKGYV